MFFPCVNGYENIRMELTRHLCTVSWACLIAETVRLRTHKIIGPSSSSPGMTEPAPPFLQAKAYDIALSDLQAPTLMEIDSVVTMVTKG